MSPLIDREQLKSCLACAANMTIGLLGDLFLDRYLEISPALQECSIETGLDAHQVVRVRNVAGALGTIINNLTALGVRRIVPISVIGNDGHGYDLMQRVKTVAAIDPQFILHADQRLTPTYTKPISPIADGTWRELNRLDVRSREPLPTAVTAHVCDMLTDVFDQIDGLIVLDQVAETDCGVVNSQVRVHLDQLTEAESDRLVFVDSRAHIGKFRRGILKGNVHELAAAANLDPATHQAELHASRAMCVQTGMPVYCTLGARGLLVVESPEQETLVEAVPVSGPIDIVGAGDSATSAIVTSLLAGASHPQAAAVANLVASITIQQIGTTGTASPGQILQRWDDYAAKSG